MINDKFYIDPFGVMICEMFMMINFIANILKLLSYVSVYQMFFEKVILFFIYAKAFHISKAKAFHISKVWSVKRARI